MTEKPQIPEIRAVTFSTTRLFFGLKKGASELSELYWSLSNIHRVVGVKMSLLVAFGNI